MRRIKQASLLLSIALSFSTGPAQPLTSSSGDTTATAVPASNGQIMTLEQAIRYALENNLSLQAASRGVRASQWGVRKAHLDFLPQLDFEFRYLRLDEGTLDRANAFYDFVQQNQDAFPPEITRNVRPGAYKDSYGPAVSIIQPIYNGGVLRSQLNFAQALDDRSNANHEDTRQQVIFDTYSAYFDVLKSQELLALAEESKRSAQEHLASTSKMLEVGMRARNEVLRFEVALATAENALIVAQNNVELARASLNRVMGRELERDFTLTPVEDVSWQAPRTLDEQMQSAINNNPGLRMIRSNVSAQSANVGLARSALLPKVNLLYSYSWEANDTWAFDSIKSWSLGVVAIVPLFHSFQDYAGLQREREALQQMNRLQEDYESAVQLQVQQSSLNLAAAEKRIAIAEKTVEEAAENVRIVNNSYQVGLLSSLDVVDAEVINIQAKARRIEARYDFFLAKAQLARAMGVLGR
jgi:outer membrane protein TolC